LGTGATADDVIEIIVYDAFSAANFYSRTDSDSRYVRHDSGTLGTDNFIAGKNAGDAIASGGNNNTLIGNEAGTSLTTGDNNVAVGFEALATEDAHGDNTAIGYQALKTLNGGADTFNVAVGYQAGTSVTTGTNNTLIGSFTGDAITDGSHNTALGISALSAETRGSRSVAVGEGTLQFQNKSDSTGNMYNTAVGYEAGNDITTGNNHTLIGANAGDKLTTGLFNTAVGAEALGADTTGSRSTAIGYAALGVQNFTSGNTETGNTAVGFEAGSGVSTGTGNTLIGTNAASSLTSGTNNVFIGQNAGASDAGISGEQVAQTTTNCVVVGKACQVSATNADSQVVLGFECTGASNTSLTFGKSTTDSNIDFGGTSITTPSDERYKENIETSTAGLGFINDLRPVTYRWKMEKDIPSDHRAYVKDSTKRVMERGDDLYHGFIAQEIKVALDKHSEVKNSRELWREDEDSRQRVGPAFLIPMLTKAIQELSAKNDALEARIKKLEDG